MLFTQKAPGWELLIYDHRTLFRAKDSREFEFPGIFQVFIKTSWLQSLSLSLFLKIFFFWRLEEKYFLDKYLSIYLNFCPFCLHHKGQSINIWWILFINYHYSCFFWRGMYIQFVRWGGSRDWCKSHFKACVVVRGKGFPYGWQFVYSNPVAWSDWRSIYLKRANFFGFKYLSET